MIEFNTKTFIITIIIVFLLFGIQIVLNKKYDTNETFSLFLSSIGGVLIIFAVIMPYIYVSFNKDVLVDRIMSKDINGVTSYNKKDIWKNSSNLEVFNSAKIAIDSEVKESSNLEYLGHNNGNYFVRVNDEILIKKDVTFYKGLDEAKMSYNEVRFPTEIKDKDKENYLISKTDNGTWIISSYLQKYNNKEEFKLAVDEVNNMEIFTIKELMIPMEDKDKFYEIDIKDKNKEYREITDTLQLSDKGSIE